MEFAFLVGNFGSVSGLVVVLGLPRVCAGGDTLDPVCDLLGCELGEAGVEFAVGFVGADRGSDNVDDIAGVHAFIHLHQGNAGFGFSVHDGPLDRGGAAVFGEDATVEIDSAALCSF